MKKSFYKFLKKQKFFIQKYELDYYSDKTPEFIARRISKNIKLVHNYLQKNHPEYYINEEFVKKPRLSLRYISSYKIDYSLSKKSEIYFSYQKNKEELNIFIQ
jgi:hypothetical protein